MSYMQEDKRSYMFVLLMLFFHKSNFHPTYGQDSFNNRANTFEGVFCKASKAWAILRSMILWIYLSKLESKFPSQSGTFLEKVFTLCNNFLKCRLHWLITLLFQNFPSLCCVCCIYIESKIFFLWLIIIRKSLQCFCRSGRCMKTF